MGFKDVKSTIRIIGQPGFFAKDNSQKESQRFFYESKKQNLLKTTTTQFFNNKAKEVIFSHVQ